MGGPPKPPQKRWKRQELRVARLLGGKRLKNQGKEAPDVAGNGYIVEVKDRKDLPQWIAEAVTHIRTQAERDQLPIVTLTSPNTRQVLVVMDMRDFRQWFGDPTKKRKEASDG